MVMLNFETKLSFLCYLCCYLHSNNMQTLMDISHIKGLYKTSSRRADTDSHITRGHTFVISVVERTRCRRHRGSSHSAGHSAYVWFSVVLIQGTNNLCCPGRERISPACQHILFRSSAHVKPRGNIYFWGRLDSSCSFFTILWFIYNNSFVSDLKGFTGWCCSCQSKFCLKRATRLQVIRQLHQHKSSVLKLMLNLRVGR